MADAKEYKIVSACLSCGTALEGAEKFCGACGAPIEITNTPPPPRPEAPRRSTIPLTMLLGLAAIAVVTIVIVLNPFSDTPQYTPQSVAPSAASQAVSPSQTNLPTPIPAAPVVQPPAPAAQPPIAQQTSAAVDAAIARTEKTYIDAGILSVAPHKLLVPSCENCEPFQLYCTTPISRVSDLKGRKVRVRPSSGGDLVRNAGGNPQLLGFSEVRAALQTGLIDCTMSGGTIPEQ